MRESITGTNITAVYDSMEEFAADAKRRYDQSGYVAATQQDSVRYVKFRGARMADVWAMAGSGWNDALPATLELCESAVAMMTRTHQIQQFTAVHDYSGADVDIARYLSGDPENMIDYPLMTISKVGKVVTLVASGAKSGAVSTAAAIRRGQVIAAFALALARLGHASELWLDLSNNSRNGKHSCASRILVKGTSDELDPARILFAYAHPSVSRAIQQAWKHGLPRAWKSSLGVRDGGGYGVPRDPEKDMGDEAIYLPRILSDRDVPDADVLLRDWLRQVGLLAE